MNIDQLNNRFKAMRKTAEQLIKNKDQTIVKIQEGIQKASKNKVALLSVWRQLQVLFSITKDYSNGSYTQLPKSAIIAIVAGLLYFISPIDLIPDFIAGLGFVDDAFILGLVYKQVTKDLEKYQLWKAAQQSQASNSSLS